MKAAASLLGLMLLIGSCSAQGRDAPTSGAPASSVAEVAGTTEVAGAPECHPANDRADCQVAVLLLDEAVDLSTAEMLATELGGYLNALFRVDPVCVTKDFPMMIGRELGETASRRVYWGAEARLDRIAAATAADLAPPPTMGGFDAVIDARILDEWRLAQEPGVLFDALVLWIDEATATTLSGDFIVDLPAMGRDFGRYTHAEGKGEIRVDRDYEPPPLLPQNDPGCVPIDP